MEDFKPGLLESRELISGLNEKVTHVEKIHMVEGYKGDSKLSFSERRVFKNVSTLMPTP